MTEQERKAFLEEKFNSVKEIVFSSGLVVGEIAQIIQALQQTLNNLGINLPKPTEEVKAEEVKEEVKSE